MADVKLLPPLQIWMEPQVSDSPSSTHCSVLAQLLGCHGLQRCSVIEVCEPSLEGIVSVDCLPSIGDEPALVGSRRLQGFAAKAW
jgi:hypothetical protein